MLERVSKKGTLLGSIGGNVNWYSHYGVQYGDSSKKSKNIKMNPPQVYMCSSYVKFKKKIKFKKKKKKKKSLKIKLSYDPVIPLLGIYLE